MEIMHAAETVELDVPGLTVGQIRVVVKHSLNVGGQEARLDGHRVSDDVVVLDDNKTLEFIDIEGHKGVGDHVWTKEEWCRVFQATPEELDHHIGNGLRVLRLSDGQLRVTESSMDEYIAAQHGDQPPTALGERLHTPKEAAPLLKLNVQTVRQHLQDGTLGGLKDKSGRWWVRQQDVERYLNARRRIHGK